MIDAEEAELSHLLPARPIAVPSSVSHAVSARRVVIKYPKDALEHSISLRVLKNPIRRLKKTHRDHPFLAKTVI